MREPSGHGIRGLLGRGCLFALGLFALLGVNRADAQAITRFVRDTGNINFVTTGGTMRTQDNNGNPCLVSTSSNQNLVGIPAGTTIRNAYLYWGGSGTTNDPNITFNGVGITASRSFSTTVLFNSTNHAYFGHFANVTSQVATTRNGNYSVTNFAVNAGNPWCGNGLVAGGWSLFVIYESATERLRAINVFDGLDSFYGSALTTVPDGFRVPPSNIDGRIGVFTLDGDPGNSGAIGAFSESLTFNTNTLDDALNVPGSVPTVQQFDGTISTLGLMTSYGVDVDQYDISTFLTPGQTSGTLRYSAGGDVVVLMAQLVSATSDPAVDLGVTMSHTGTFVAGGTGTYSVIVSNAAGVEREDNTVTVTDTLPAGLSFNSFSGTGWNCTAAGQVVTCTHAPTLNAGASFPTLSIVVNVAEAAAASVTNSVTVSTTSFDSNSANNTATDPTATLDPNLSTSTKTVQDLNGGDAAPGDVLRYTITLTESAGGQAVNVSLTDDVPANTTWAGFVSVPAGATSSFAPDTLTVSNITVPANGSVTVVFDVTVDNVSAGATIDNEADIVNPNGPDATPDAPTVIVLASSVPQSGTKQLYLWSNPVRLMRTRPTGTHNAISLNGNNQTQTFTLTPAMQTQLILNPGSFTVNLLLTRTGTITTTQNRVVTVTLANSGTGNIASASQTITSGTQTMYTFTLNTAGVTVPVNSTFSLAINNNSGNTTNRSISITPYNGANYSRVNLNSATIINVNNVQTWTQAFNGGVQQSSFYPGATVYIRAQVSDPFGSFDISGATVQVLDPNNNVVQATTAMTAQGAPATCGSQSAATCIFQFAYTIPASPPLGGYTVRVTANEGVEGVFDLGVGSFVVVLPQPSLTILKTSTVLSDPLNLTTNPKRIPLSTVRYDITVTNSGPGTIDAGTLVISDAIPSNSSMYVATGSGDPVVFINGAGSNASGLTYTYATSVSYSNVGASGPWGYTPMPDVNGFDPVVRAVRIVPAGVMLAAGAGNPTFTLQFRVRVN